MRPHSEPWPVLSISEFSDGVLGQIATPHKRRSAMVSTSKCSYTVGPNMGLAARQLSYPIKINPLHHRDAAS